MGFFTGLFGSIWSSPQASFTVPVKPYLPYNTSYVGHVIDVILDKSHPQYDPEKNQVVGTIFWRNALRSGDAGSGPSAFDEAEKAKTANPIDRSNFKLPLPGEQVTIIRAKSSRLDGPDIFLVSKFYYDRIISMTANNVYNGAPFIGINPERLNPFLPGARTVGELSRRFDDKIRNLAMFKPAFNRGKPEVKPQIEVSEGDFVLQGRFGGSIRFTQTPTFIEAQKQTMFARPNNPGTAGDPLIIMRCNADESIKFSQLDDPDKLYVQEDLSTDAASLYLASTQQLRVRLAVPNYKGEKQPKHPLISWGFINEYSNSELDGQPKDGEAARDNTSPKQTTKTETEGSPPDPNEVDTNDGSNLPQVNVATNQTGAEAAATQEENAQQIQDAINEIEEGGDGGPPDDPNNP